MRKYIMLFMLGTLLGGCSESTIENPTVITSGLIISTQQIGSTVFHAVRGDVESHFTMTSDKNWVLEGAVAVQPEATLTIEAGTRIYGAFGTETAFLTVLQGGRIEAVGTADKPIVFSTIRKITSIPQPGDWGGIIINGNAPVNIPGGIGTGEGGSGSYGGSIPTDDSGILKYVIVEYGGKILGVDNEMNNISLNGCGSSTEVDYVQALYGKDDGIEIFGGTVNVSHAISMGNGDDSFDWTFGWSGFGQHWLVVQDDHDGDKGIEADNNENDFLLTPVSNPIIANLTIIGEDDGDASNVGIRLRHGTQGTIYNALVTNFSKHGVEVKDKSIDYIGNELMLDYSVVYNNGEGDPDGKNFKNCDHFEYDLQNATSDPMVLQGYVGVVENAGFDVSTLDPWFEQVNYIGAVPSANDWTTWANPLR